MNVYYVKYQTDGSYWPLAHNATIFSLILTQVVAGILFGMKKSSSASTSTIPLIIGTALFNVFCKNRFLPLFRNRAAQVTNSINMHAMHGYITLFLACMHAWLMLMCCVLM